MVRGIPTSLHVFYIYNLLCLCCFSQKIKQNNINEVFFLSNKNIPKKRKKQTVFVFSQKILMRLFKNHYQKRKKKQTNLLEKIRLFVAGLQERKQAKKKRAEDEAKVDAVGEMFQADRGEEVVGEGEVGG